MQSKSEHFIPVPTALARKIRKRFHGESDVVKALDGGLEQLVMTLNDACQGGIPAQIVRSYLESGDGTEINLQGAETLLSIAREQASLRSIYEEAKGHMARPL